MTDSLESSTLQATNPKEQDIIEEQLNLGDKYQALGNNEEALKHYQSAVDSSIILNNKKLQIDALCKISYIYYLKNDVAAISYYTEEAEKILKHIDYTKGTIEVTLSKVFLCNTKHDFIKVREIGNQGIKMCGENYLYYKGRFLIVLADAYSEITEISEHLSILQQAQKCFEEAGSVQGILGTLNNIASLYADQLQNNEKAFEYFLLFKEKSETTSLREFHMLANLNVGEILLKMLRYEEALVYLEEGLQIAVEINNRRYLFYSLSGLIDTCIKLQVYKAAFNYYVSAREELENHPHQGVWVIYYYKTLSLLLLEFGVPEEAKAIIIKSLNMFNDDSSILKWDSGFVYEMIKLKAAKNTADITDGLAAVNFILSKYKNDEVILDKAYDYAIELVHQGYTNYALEFIGSYKHLKANHGSLKLRELYIKTFTLDNNSLEKLSTIKQAIDLAVKTKNEKLHYKLCIAAGDYYNNNEDLENSKCYYSLAEEILNGLVLTIPEQYKLSFTKELTKKYEV